MKRVWWVLLVALLGALVTAPAVSAAPAATAFSGHWQAEDPADGSQLDLFVGLGDRPKVTFLDDEATLACAGLDDQSWESFNTAVIDGSVMVTTMRWAKCGNVPVGGGFAIEWELDDQGNADPSDDVLTNDFDEEYVRVP
jgi:hypothetical protein